jgi:trans-aconitate 2-methyltransferase
VDGHERLLPKLADELAPGGALAAQVPNNFGAPSHRLLRELALSPRWAARLGGQIRPWPVLSPEQYLELLSPKLRSLNVWTTRYLHLLSGANPVLDWMCGAAIRPLLAALASEAERVRFKAEYGALLEEAYPRRPDGSTLFPFERIFLIGYR